ncbi:MAG TPA: glycosyltransferase family 4 protein [Gemmataceae bacterium]
MTHLLLSDNFPPRTGGSGRWFWETYRRLPRENYAVAAGEDPRQVAFDRTHDLRLWRLPLTLKAWGLRSLTGLTGYWRALRRLRPLLRSERIEMVHCGRCLPEGVMALALKWRYRLPYLCYVHGEDVTTAMYSREHAWMVRRVLHNAEFLIANSRNTERVLRDEWGLSAERVRVLHPGVDTDYFSPAGRDRAIRERLGWGDRPVILTVGRLQKRKGHDVMIRALSAVRRAVPDVLYVVAGDGEERPALDALTASEGAVDHVQFLGEISDADLLSCYRQCDLFALPNRQVGQDIEGFGMVLLEAQACGKPVVAGASGGTAETMRIPETGRVVCCDGPDELAALVSDLLSDRRRLEQMGQAAREWVVSRFDWEVLTRQAEQLFRFGPSLAQSQAILEPACP